MKAKIKMVRIILTVVGGIIAYLAVFKDAFGGASGFLAVVGVAIFACGFCPLFGISGEDIEAEVISPFITSRAFKLPT